MTRLLLCGALLASGCAQTESSDLLTSGIYASITAEAEGDGTTDVRTTLYVGNPINLNFVNLTGDDRLIARHGNDDNIMVETVLLNVVSYHATFQGDAANEAFEVALVRSIDDGAPRSTVTLPAPFTLNAPPTSASRAQPLTLSWGPTDTDLIRWRVEGDCIELETMNLGNDTGTLTIEPDRIMKRMGEMVADSCPITVTVTRYRLGQLDPGYGKGGVVEGQQSRKVMLTTIP